MGKLLKEIKHDAEFIKGHQLQPQWYKILKVFLLLGLIIGSYLVFGPLKMLVFFGCFFSLSLLVHMVYRINTKKFSQSWLDFEVVEEDGISQPRRIGKYYYLAVLTNALISFAISLLV